MSGERDWVGEGSTYRRILAADFTESVVSIVTGEISGRCYELLPQGGMFLKEKYIFHVERDVFAVMKLVKP